MGFNLVQHGYKFEKGYTPWNKRGDKVTKKCLICDQRGRTLNADHIKPFALYSDLRFDPNNGRTLCVDCHKKTDTYGRRRIYAH